MTKQDYYKVLGLDKTATDDEIKKAYKELARKWHPDKNSDNKDEAVKKFQLISEAYGVLSDTTKRKTYDNFGFAGLDGDINGEGHPFGFDPFSMFRDFFQKENNIPEIQVQIKLTLNELYCGTKKNINFERFTLCKDCNAKGCIGDDIECKKCSGKGISISRTRIGIIQTQCSFCNGKGVDLRAPKCKTCKGNGCYKEDKSMLIEIPKGTSEKHPIIIDNEGNEIPKDERNGRNTRSTVIVIISEQKHQKYNRGTVIKEIGKVNENNLLIEVKLSLEESLCGFEKVFTHLDGKHFKFSMSEFVRHGDIFVMKEYGMPYYQEDKKGDLFIKVFVEKKKITKEKKMYLWKLLSEDKYKEINNTSENIINYNDYKTEMIEQNKKESMKNKYRQRKDDEIDDDDGRPQCVQQ